MHTSIAELEAESDYNLYSKHLASLGYGIPLWQPAPLSDYKRVKIADVGYIRTGQFYRLFNASLPSDDPAQCRGVPANFQPLRLDEISSEHKQFRMPGVLHTKGMRLDGVDFNPTSNPAWIEHEQSVSFESSTRRGAILVTKDVTLREDAVQLGFLEAYMAENYESWLEMANVALGRGIKLEDLILVTGCDLTKECAMAAFDGGESDFAITFKAAYPPPESSSFSTWGQWHTASSAVVFKNFGGHQVLHSTLLSEIQSPSAPELPPRFSTSNDPEFNQCIFLRGFRIRRRPTPVTHITGTLTNLGRDDQEENSNALCLSDHIDSAGPIQGEEHDGSIAVESIADKQPFTDPLEPHFEHIFQGTEVQKALVHDTDISIPLKADEGPDDNSVVPILSPKVKMINNEVWRINPSEPSRTSDLNPLSTSGIQPLLPSPSMEPADWTFPPVPMGLKGVSAYLQRAQELKVKNPIIAYWCTHFAVKQVILSTVQNEEIRLFLGQIVYVLEGMKASLGDNDAVLRDDVSAKYIANFAMRVFKKADGEDQKRKANRSTAKKFLASATFFELLRLFEQPIEAEIEEKIHYAKWKAADIAKAFREGRIPIPGNIHAPSHIWSGDSVATPAASEANDLPHDAMSAWSPGASIALSLAPSPAVQGLNSLESSPVVAPYALPHTMPDLGHGAEEPESHPQSPTHSPPPSDRVPSPTIPFSSPYQFDSNPNSGDIEPAQTEANDEVNERTGGFIWNWSSIADERGVESEEVDRQEDEWSTSGIRSTSRQGSWTITDDVSVTPEGAPMLLPSLSLDVQPEGPPPMAIVKRVRFSPSVVGGLSSTSSSVAASSPPASPERYAPSLPTVPEASSDSDREGGGRPNNGGRPLNDPASIPLPESTASSSESSLSDSDDSEGWAHGAPPVITKVPSPTSPPSPSSHSSTKILSQAPSISLTAPSPQFHPRFLSAFSPHPAASPALHPTPRFFPHTLALYANNNSPPTPSDGSASPELDTTQVTEAQRHCRFAISALEYEDAEAARSEIRAALAMLDE